MSEQRSEEWARLTEDERSLLEGFQNDPKVPLGQIARKLGIQVKSSTLPANISGEIRPSEKADSKFIIRINRHETKPRQRFTLAHEISHYLLHRNKIGKGVSDNVMYRSTLSNTLEAQANRLAADLLMPWHLLSELIKDKDIQDDTVIKEVAETLGVSKVALKIRLGIGN